MAIDWTQEVITDLDSMWASGMSASQIANKLSFKYRDSFSRSAVIGKVHRLGLTRSPSMNTTARRTSSRKAAKRAAAAGKPRPFMPDSKPAKKPTTFTATSNKTGLFVSGKVLPTAPMPVEDVPPVDLVKFADLSEQSCKWIYGDPKESSHGYCGKQVVPGLSWCSGHRTRVFSPPVVRQRPPQPVYVPTVADLEKV